MDDVAERILTAASELLDTEGPAAVSTRAIAARAGTTTMSIVSRFGNKAGVIDALYSEGFDRLRARLSSGTQLTDPVEEIRRLAGIYRASALTDAGHFQVMFGQPFPEYRPTRQARADALSAFGLVIEAAERLASSIGLPHSPDDLALEVWAAIHGVTALEHSGLIGTDQADRIHASLVADLLAGLGA